MAYSNKVVDHFENPKNVGSMDSKSNEVGTGLVGQIHSHMLTRMYQQLGNWERNWTQPVQPLITIVGLVVLVIAYPMVRGYLKSRKLSGKT